MNFTDQQVFDQATTYTNLLFLSKAEKRDIKYAELRKIENPSSQMAIIQKNNRYANNTLHVDLLPIGNISEQPWQFGFGGEAILLAKLNKFNDRLSAISDRIFQGIVTGADPVFILERRNTENESRLIEVYSKALDKRALDKRI